MKVKRRFISLLCAIVLIVTGTTFSAGAVSDFTVGITHKK